MADFSINELKKHLGPGFGLRKNRYMIEIPIPTANGRFLNILCQSAGLPETSINTVDMWHKGRRYRVRGEIDYGGEYEISIVDDSDMTYRKIFDDWLKAVDDSRPDRNASLLGASFEQISPGLLDNLESLVSTGNMIKNAINNPSLLADFLLGFLDVNRVVLSSSYQMDINIWQMGPRGDENNKIYGYKLQNAFPKEMGIVTLDDGDENTLSEFSITFAFSEFIPLYGIKEDINEGIFGGLTTDIIDGLNELL